jgi:hypothetical protein
MIPRFLPRLPNPIIVPEWVIPSYRPPTPLARGCCVLGGSPLADPTALGPHLLNAKDTVGMVYTCAAGFVDLGHLRDMVDLTLYYHRWITIGKRRKAGVRIPASAATTPLALLRGKLPAWMGKLLPPIPDGFVELKRDVAPGEEIEAARSMAYAEGVLHELDTYWVNHLKAPEPWDDIQGMHNSAFSPEDLYSNYLGSYVGGAALALASTDPIEVAVTRELDRVLATLGAQPKHNAQAALQAIAGDWFVFPLGSGFLRRRNFHWTDVKPSLVPGVAFCTSTSEIPPELRTPLLAIDSLFEATYFPAFSIMRYIRSNTDLFFVMNDIWAGDIGMVIKSSRFGAEVERARQDALRVYGNNAEAP